MKKKLVAIGLSLALLLVSIPAIVNAAIDCKACCYLFDTHNWYKVSYFDESDNWVTRNVSAWNRDLAAESLDKKAGYDCFVTFIGTDQEPVKYNWKVRYLDDGVFKTEFIEVETRGEAAGAFGLRAGYNCWVTKVLGG